MGRRAVASRDILLAILGAEGKINVPGKSPNMAALFSPVLKTQYSKPQLTRAVYRLRKMKLVKVQRQDGNTQITLTDEGKRIALRYAVDDVELEKPFRWDGHWHIVMFDIPNVFRVARNSLRTRIKRMGLLPLQESVWISPYPCREEIRFLAQMLHLEAYVKTMTVAELDPIDTTRFKNKFGLH